MICILYIIWTLAWLLCSDRMPYIFNSTHIKAQVSIWVLHAVVQRWKLSLKTASVSRHESRKKPIRRHMVSCYLLNQQQVIVTPLWTPPSISSTICVHTVSSSCICTFISFSYPRSCPMRRPCNRSTIARGTSTESTRRLWAVLPVQRSFPWCVDPLLKPSQ